MYLLIVVIISKRIINEYVEPRAAEEYEDTHYPFPMPKTISEMVELKRFQLKLTQAAIADMIRLGKPKLSQILNGKREPDVSFLKAVYKKPDIDPGFFA